MLLHEILITLGALFLMGLAVDAAGRLTGMPRVTLLILFGVAIGPLGFDLLPRAARDWYDFLAAAALTMVAFVLGGALTVKKLKTSGKRILVISLTVVATTMAIVSLGLAALGFAIVPALALAGIATATDPAATQDVVKEAGIRSPFSDTLLGIVAIDDAWGLIAFSLMMVLAKQTIGDGSTHIVMQAARDLGGAVLVGSVIGLPAAYLTGRIRAGEPLLLEILGVVLLCAGLAIWLDVSFLLAGMVAGFMVANLASHHRCAFHEIEHVEWPFVVLFFVLAGASLEPRNLASVWPLLVAYVLLRTSARLAGGWLGAFWSGADPVERRWMGVALMPQAGVAVGMALVAGRNFPQHEETILAVAVAATILFEVVGPVLTRLAVTRTADAARHPGPNAPVARSDPSA